MKLKSILIFLFLIGIGLFFFFTIINNYFGWYGYKKWENRNGTNSIAESKKRGIFLKELNYKIVESQNLHDFEFKPYFEKGFKYGVHSSEETNPVKFSKYPINLSFERNKNDSIALNIINKEKADSSDIVWTFFEKPKLKDTIFIQIDGSKNKNGKMISGKIKIW